MSRGQSTRDRSSAGGGSLKPGSHFPDEAWRSKTSCSKGVFGLRRTSSGKIPICEQRIRYLSMAQGTGGIRRRNRDNRRSIKSERDSRWHPVHVPSSPSKILPTERSLTER